MSKTALFRRVPKPVEIEGETVYVRSLTLRESREIDRLNGEGKDEEAMLYGLRAAVVDDKGECLFVEGENDPLGDVPLSTVKELFAAIIKVTNPIDVKRAEKN